VHHLLTIPAAANNLDSAMSGAYSLFHVINELLDEKSNKNSTARGKTMGAKSEIYQGSWNALNAWMETRLAKQKVRLHALLIVIM